MAAPYRTERHIDLSTLTGIDTTLRFLATKYKQGGRTVYGLHLSPDQIIRLIPKNDPAQATPGNRALKPAHAKGFATYFRERSTWVVPGMILRGPAIFNFEADTTVAGVDFGILSFPHLGARDIRILDGQHRIEGFHLAAEGIAEDLEKARQAVQTAKRVDSDGPAVRHAEQTVKDLEQQRTRLQEEHVSLEIFIEEDAMEFKQMFFDIADNALGITGSVKSRFDSRKVVNRSMDAVLEHPLLLGRVDPESDRPGRTSPHLLGAKHVAEIIRSVEVGLDGRVSKRMESELKEADVSRHSLVFFDVLTEAFPDLAKVMDGTLTPAALRTTSLLGSVLTLRVLAGAYHDLKKHHAFTTEAVTDYFAELSEYMVGPVTEASIWHTELPDIFTVGVMAPQGRRQDLKKFNQAVTAWGVLRPDAMNEPTTEVA